MPTRPRSRYGLPSYAQTIGSALLGTGQYREEAFVAGADESWSTWGDFANRKLRYALFQAHVDGSVYRKIQRFAAGLKADHDLYSYVRPVLSPAYRCVEFWSQNIMGGILDPEAGDGKAVPSCLPILTENNAIRPVLAALWKRSNWQTYKDVWTLDGASMGDAPRLIVDDPYRRTVYHKVIHPGTVRECELDDYGNVKGYVREEIRVHPEADRIAGVPRLATYSEECRKVGARIVYTTYLDGEEYDWRDYPEGTPDRDRHGPTWSEDYGFVPMVMVQHRNRGLGWGWSELQPSTAKLHELDDMASKLCDGVRSASRPRWFFSGMDPSTKLDYSADDEDDPTYGVSSDYDQDTVERNTEDSIKVRDAGARPWPLVADLNIAAAADYIAGILAAIERDHPELTADQIGLNASGKARRVAQERLEATVVQRRVGYDDGEVRANMMAISIGAIKGYPGFEGFTGESYERGELDHTIGNRPVFTVDELDRLEEKQARATLYKTLVDGGMPIVDAAEEAGYPPERIATLKASAAKAEAKSAADARALAENAAGGDVGRVSAAMPGVPASTAGEGTTEAVA